MRTCAVFVAVFLLCATCRAQLLQQNLVQVHLIADTATISPGKAFRLGIVFNITPGWHIYWTNPGDAGLATKVTVHVPEGFSVEPIVYPVPAKFVMPGGIVCYGYHSQLMLIATIKPPAELSGQQVPISVDASYLVCENICVGGKKSQSILLSVGTGSGQRDIEQFDHWSSLLPIPAMKSPAVKSISFDDTSVTILWNEPVSDVQFFPGASDAVAIQHITALNEGKQTQILFVPKYYDKSKLTPISCVAGLIDSHGVHRAVEFSIMLKGT